MTMFTFTQDVSRTRWHALPRDFKAGEKVHRYTGQDYGCCRDDMRFGGFETVACSLDGGLPFFTVPVKYLRDENNKPPMWG
jgi:hypothetical protein